LATADIPFAGPVGAALVGHLDGGLLINPEMADMANSRLDLVVAGTKDAVLMVEAGAQELTEDEMLEAVKQGHAICKQLCELQEQLVALAGRPKREFTPPAVDTSLEEAVATYMGDRLKEAINNPDKTARQEATDTLRRDVL